MINKTVTINHSEEHDFDIATRVVQAASQFTSRIDIVMNEKSVNAKSIMGMTYLMLIDGDQVNVVCTGADEEKALAAVETVLEK